jgi:hypothetical protein
MSGLTKQFIGFDDDRMVVKISGQTDPAREAVRQAKEAGWGQHNIKDDLGLRLMHRLPMIVVHMMLRESGIKPGNVAEFDEYVAKRLATGEFDHFKVYEGRA